ncbi:DUF1491 family protein [Erythrobacter sp. THAF29]|uniref:DUF1491 family protein n=1 Tax=Erythrobacter sp. THAF29 TaxID=2587851 RepID=UPI001267BBEE|nr:DUF1491 family protein [Erythrobacter sp. THAF29]QFT76381.1 hypothetical protein FIU90_02380 [Erythrobacter sp. THAF29]
MSEPTRLPAHLEVASLIRLAESNGGMATVLHKGERDAGTLLVVTMYRGENAKLYERMPQLDGSRAFVLTKEQDSEKPYEFNEYLARRYNQDPDIWVIEVDIDEAERFIALLPR